MCSVTWPINVSEAGDRPLECKLVSGRTTNYTQKLWGLHQNKITSSQRSGHRADNCKMVYWRNHCWGNHLRTKRKPFLCSFSILAADHRNTRTEAFISFGAGSANSLGWTESSAFRQWIVIWKSAFLKVFFRSHTYTIKLLCTGLPFTHNLRRENVRRGNWRRKNLSGKGTKTHGHKPYNLRKRGLFVDVHVFLSRADRYPMQTITNRTLSYWQNSLPLLR